MYDYSFVNIFILGIHNSKGSMVCYSDIEDILTMIILTIPLDGVMNIEHECRQVVIVICYAQ